MEPTWRFPEVFFPLFIQKQSFYRDRLRTNVGKTQKRLTFFVQAQEEADAEAATEEAAAASKK
eukprot:COSAG02_NODE_6752_length_3383_cov_2.048112_2_plen_62_part_01